MLNYLSFDVFCWFKNSYKFSWILFKRDTWIDNYNFFTIRLSISKILIKLTIINYYVSVSDIFNLLL